MPRYLLSTYQPSGGTPDPQRLERIKAELHRLNEQLRESGSWVFTADCTFLTGQRSFAPTG